MQPQLGIRKRFIRSLSGYQTSICTLVLLLKCLLKISMVSFLLFFVPQMASDCISLLLGFTRCPAEAASVNPS